ncbi:PLC-like phosphodiesterase [Myxozyma melibiosi]|uniref:Phosphoinositide phospholipase C n=1 Tax=Myxozyma melibiosi TaxID=54550 RepID=A0ABR1EYH0_9ASCO
MADQAHTAVAEPQVLPRFPEISLAPGPIEDQLRDLYASQHTTGSFEDFVKQISEVSTSHLPSDTSHPFSHYYISSSHNTYLTQNQLSGKASVDGYVNALLSGARCIEIDVWNGKNGNPKVVHGWTLVHPVDFKEVCEAIAENAFKTTPFPLLLSLETHCDHAQQGAMAEIMHETFGDMLLSRPLNPFKVLPSLEDLKHKILVITASMTEKEDAAAAGSQSPKTDSDSSSVKSNGSDSSCSSEEASAPAEQSDEVEKIGDNSVNPSLAALGIYAIPRPFENLFNKFSLEFNHIHNVSERMFSNLRNKPPPDSDVKDLPDEDKLTPRAVILHNSAYLMRIYPNGYRFNSSNPYAPLYWAYGAQIVALNWQKVDKANMLNRALFEGTGGYVLKPNCANNDGQSFDTSLSDDIHELAHKFKESLRLRPSSDSKKSSPEVKESTESITQLTGKLKVRVIGVQNMPIPSVSKIKDPEELKPYVKIEVIQAQVEDKYLDKIGIPPKSAVLKETTDRSKTLKGSTVVWDKSETYDVASELSFVRIKVYNNDGLFGKNDPSLWWAIRIGNWKPGYSLIRPYLMNGEIADSSVLLLVELSWV